MPTGRIPDASHRETIAHLKEQLGLFQDDDNILLQALTHCSYANERDCVDYERLEFLGDAVLSLVLSHELFVQCGNETEGFLTRLRAMMVNEDSLAEVARSMDLGHSILLSVGEQKTGGRMRKSILADVVEAIIGALYLQYGIETARKFVLEKWRERIGKYLSGDRPIDAKTTLQEFLQSKGRKPEYRLIGAEGPDHARIFTVEVMTDGEVCGLGSGSSKKEAEQTAAAAALKNLHPSGTI